MGRPGQHAKVLVSSGLLSIALNLLLIPRNGILAGIGIAGIEGAALAALVSTVAMLAGLHHYSNRLVRRRVFNPRGAGLHIIAGAAMAVSMWGAAMALDALRWYHLGGLAAMGVGVYLIALWAMGEFRKADLDFMLETVNARKLLRHVRDELGDRPQR
jgi:Co/Zn/Cd efflux system component